MTAALALLLVMLVMLGRASGDDPMEPDCWVVLINTSRFWFNYRCVIFARSNELVQKTSSSSIMLRVQSCTIQTLAECAEHVRSGSGSRGRRCTYYPAASGEHRVRRPESSPSMLAQTTPSDIPPSSSSRCHAWFESGA